MFIACSLSLLSSFLWIITILYLFTWGDWKSVSSQNKISALSFLGSRRTWLFSNKSARQITKIMLLRLLWVRGLSSIRKSFGYTNQKISRGVLSDVVFIQNNNDSLKRFENIFQWRLALFASAQHYALLVWDCRTRAYCVVAKIITYCMWISFNASICLTSSKLCDFCMVTFHAVRSKCVNRYMLLLICSCRFSCYAAMLIQKCICHDLFEK